MRRINIAVLFVIGMMACSSEPGTASTGSASGGTGTGSGGGSGSGSGSGGSGGGSTTGGSTTDGGIDAGDTWTDWASPQFFQTYCVSCHQSGKEGDASGGKDFTLYSDVSANAGLIRCGVAVTQNADWNCGSIVPEQFPIEPGPKPSAEQRDRLVDWIDAGFPQ